ncbi:site-2 protease family protein [bacterium]|nr:site-2 protease family protein [candidate division CSSED10-310 bacterium]
MAARRMKGLFVARLFGIPITLDYSWFLIFGLIAWSLAGGYFKNLLPWLKESTHWFLGIGAALLLFVSILLHELAHSLVAKAAGLKIRGITLHIFGGIAELEGDAKTPKEEIKIAAAGPFMSLLLSLLFLILGLLASQPELKAVYGYLFFINFILALFNLIPGFPLDGGRIFRGIIWLKTQNFYKATRWAVKAGTFFAYLLMVYGFFLMLKGALFGGIWFLFIGFFLRHAADSSYRYLILTRGLKGMKVKDMMITDYVSVPSHLTIQDFVNNYVLKHRHNSFPVIEDGKWAGIVSLNNVKQTPRESWEEKHVKDIMTPAEEDLKICEECDLSDAFVKTAENGLGRVAVLNTQDQLVGYLSFRDLETLVAVKGLPEAQ